MVIINTSIFGTALNPLTTKPVDVYRIVMTNNNNMSVAILTLGATIQMIKYPDKHGNIEDICLGFDNIQGYIDHKTKYIGATIGRVANRVAQAKFTLDEKECCLTKNLKDKHQLNGGFIGFDSMIWELIEENENGIILQHINPAGSEGYPGQLTTTITYNLDDNNNLGIYIEAKANRKTPVNISNNLYLNLAGHNTRKEALFQHNIMIKSNKIVECDKELIPTGCLMPVKHTPHDLRKYVNLGKRLKKFFNYPNKGFHNNYCIDSCEGQVKPIAKVIHPCSGRWLEIFSDQPSVHFSTCNDWPDIDKAGAEPIIGKSRAVYAQYGAFCLACQNYPDAMNQCNFPNVFIGPKQKYCHTVVYRFGCCE
ncbi:galactose mutarotase-like [Lucilia sericata]|uniref:galactose mutarotase-like n=1 Tax=Lucilia sericata TaxID=13632 RepID=UPI0018A80383|nr:galactose mutarotase-like [Lucilia sericata]